MPREEKAVFTNMCMVTDNKGNVLVLDRQNPDWPGLTFPGGHVEPGEAFARVSGYDLAEPAESSSYAGYKDWFIQEFRRPGYTIEVGTGENPLPLAQFDQIYNKNVGILVTAATGIPT